MLRRGAALAGTLALCLLLLLGAGTSAAAPADGPLLVTLDRDADRGTTDSLFGAAGVRLLERMRPLPIYRVAPEPGTPTDAALGALRASPLVRAAEPEGEQAIQLVPNNSLYRPYQWNLRRIGMEQAWDLRPSAPDVVVAVLDTGVDLTHPGLRPNLLLDQGYDFINDSPSPQDDESHGTAVAGIIGAVGDSGEGVAGIAWHVRLLPIKALNAQGRGPDSAMVKAILYAADAGARVLNISSTGDRYSAALEAAVAYARDRGALVVAAAGNGGERDDGPTYPAAFDGVLAVGAIDDHDQLAPFSQRGPYVGLVAPGVDVPSTAWPGAGRGPYASQSGTSIAAPHVSGVAALLWALRPDLTAADLAAALRATADSPAWSAAPRLAPDEPGSGFGAGVLNAARAVAALRLGLPPRTADAVTSQPDTPAAAPVPSPSPLPAEPRRWLFAEGSTKPPFDVWFALQNPNATATTARFTFLPPEGKPTTRELRLEPSSRTSLHANDVLPGSDFAASVEAELPIYVERSVYFGHSGHSATGARQPSQSWYLAEGSTTPPFDTWILLMNPNPGPATAKLSFMREDGTVTEQTELVPGSARRSVYVNQLFTASGFATQVTADQPIVVERAMYFDAGQAGHDALAVAAPARSWYLAAGMSRGGFDTWVLAQNPGSQPANATVSLLTDTGAAVTQPLLIPAHGRASLYTNLVLPNAAYGIRVDADQPIVVERSVYFDAGRSGFDAVGVPAPASEWFLPEGATSGSFTEQLAVVNPQQRAANVQVEFRRQDGEAAPPQRFSVGATTQLVLDVNPFAPDADVALHVTADQPVVVERTSFFARASGLGATSSTGLTR